MPDVRIHNLRVYLKPSLIAWAIYLFLVPFYVFKSGLPQPGDMFVLILVPFVMHKGIGKQPAHIRLVVRPLVWFSFWVCLVNYSWALILGNYGLFGTDTFLLYPIYYVYNTLLFLVPIILFQRYGDTFLRVTLAMTLVTIGLLVASSVVQTPGARGSLFFNNPNQLGYYALLAACLIVLLHWRLRLRLVTSSSALTACGYLAAVSASRAAIGGVAILLALLVFSNPRFILVSAVVTLALLFAGGPIAEAVEQAQDRIENRRSADGFLAERGYDRIMENQRYLVFGAGEGGLHRFADDPRQHKEIHSSFGTVLFSYGVIGTVLFFVFLWRLVRGAPVRLMVVLLPPLLYTVAHQGLRFTMFWVLLALFLAIKAELFRTQGKAAGLKPLRSM